MHLGVLSVLNRGIGADFDARQIVYRVTYVEAARRVDTCLVARRTVRVETARHGALVLRSGESVRMVVDCKFDRARVESMLASLGLEPVSWRTDGAARHALALAAPGRGRG